jgi:hypothetical protein
MAMELTMTGPGSWAASPLPIAPLGYRIHGYLEGVYGAPGNGHLFYSRLVPGADNALGLWCIRKTDGIWGAPLLLGREEDSNRILSGSSNTFNATAKLSPDGTRLVVAYGNSRGVYTYHLTPAGWIETLISGNVAQQPYLRMGMDKDSRIRIILSPIHYFEWLPVLEYGE